MRSKIFWFSCLLFLIIAFLLGNMSVLSQQMLNPNMQSSLEVICLVLAVLSAACTNLAKVVGQSLLAARLELDKIAWPSRKEVLQSMFLVCVVTLVMALYIWILDSFWNRIISWLMGG